MSAHVNAKTMSELISDCADIDETLMGQLWFLLITAVHSGSMGSIGERERAQNMYHVLGDTSYLVRGLVFGIRPSIAWRLGVPIPPLDNLTADGHLGWQVGLQSVLRRHRRSPDKTPETVISWLESQTRADRQKGASATEIIGTLLRCETALDNDILAMSTETFVQVWSKNLNESASTRQARTIDPALRRIAALAVTRLRCYPDTDRLLNALHSYCDLADVVEAGAEHSRLGRATPRPEGEDLTAPHGLIQPLLHPPLAHRADWLEVLAETQRRQVVNRPRLSRTTGLSARATTA